ncbi:MAG: hypothetical protein V3V59_03430 [Thermodesulfovibrionales bacterium]
MVQEDYGPKLINIAKLWTSAKYESVVSMERSVITISTKTESIIIYFVFLLLVIVPPVAIIVDDPSYGSYVIGAGWFLFFGYTFYKLMGGDISARFDLKNGTVELSSNDPLITLLRKVIPFRLPWERRYMWNRFSHIKVKMKQYGKTRFSRGFRLYFRSYEGKLIPFAEFMSEQLAYNAASIIAEMTACEME